MRILCFTWDSPQMMKHSDGQNQPYGMIREQERRRTPKRQSNSNHHPQPTLGIHSDCEVLARHWEQMRSLGAGELLREAPGARSGQQGAASAGARPAGTARHGTAMGGEHRPGAARVWPQRWELRGKQPSGRRERTRSFAGSPEKGVQAYVGTWCLSLWR